MSERKALAETQAKSQYMQLRNKRRTQTVVCKICGLRFVSLTHSHLAMHGVTSAEYKRRYGVKYLCCEETRFRIGERNQRMTPEEVLERLRSMARSGKRLFASEMQGLHPSLYQSASHAFGTWLRAVEAAGLDLAEHTKRNSRYRWSRELIIAEIRKRHVAGMPMYGFAVQKDQRRLYAAAQNYFSGWRNALEAAGLHPDIHSPKFKWSRGKIIRAILEREGANRPIAQADVARDNMPLYQAACHHFGNWSKALDAAGFSSWSITRRKSWTRQRVVKSILRDYRRGLPLNYGAVKRRDRKLANAARSKCGGWDQALQCAGLNPQEHRLRRPFWSREELIAAIRELFASGEGSGKRNPQIRSVYEAALRQFGSWKNAMEIALP